jgi:hypothetical protein
MLKHQAGARTKDSTSSHLSALRRGQVPSTPVAGGDESVVSAAGPRSDVRLGDSSWRFRPRAGVLLSMRSTACPRQTLHHAHAPWPRAKPLTSIRRYRARVTVIGRSPDGPAVRSGLRTRVRGCLSARRGRGERRGSERRAREESWSGSPDADGRKRNNTIRAERPPSVTNPQGLACTGSKQQLLHAIDNALG